MKTLAGLLCVAMVGLLAMPAGLGPVQAAAEDRDFRPIFDGKTLAGWDGDPRLWRVEDGTITGESTKENPIRGGNTFLIWRGGKPGDFELKAEFRMPYPGVTNSGIQIRSWEGPQKWRVFGYQPDMDSSDTYTGTCYGENFRGGLAGRGQKTVIGADHKVQVVEQFADGGELAKFIKRGDWNEYDIIAFGNRIIEKLNGQVMCEVIDEDTIARKDGIIAFQLHMGPPMKVQFRNVRIKDIAVAPKKIVLIAGGPSHGYSDHEHYAGCRVLAKCLNENVPGIEAVVYKGYPKNPNAFDGAAGIVIYSDGGGGHLAIPHLDEIDKLMKKGVGLACLHFGVEVPKGKPGNCFKDWIGGYFEPFWSVNPTWSAEFKEFPSHPVANGVKPFRITDEWYYHMRFQDDMAGVTPILTAVPPDSTHRNENTGYGGNPYVFARKGMPEHVSWVRQRPDGGRGFGFTGGHFHWNWGCDPFRKVVLNAIVWTAGIEVPPGGVPSKTPTFEELEANQDKPQPANFNKDAVRKMLEGFRKEAAAAR